VNYQFIQNWTVFKALGATLNIFQIFFVEEMVVSNHREPFRRVRLDNFPKIIKTCILGTLYSLCFL